MKVLSFLEGINKPAVSLLLDTNFSKEIRIVFQKGQIKEDHQAPFAIIVQVVKGCIGFGVNKEIKKLNVGDLIYLKP